MNGSVKNNVRDNVRDAVCRSLSHAVNMPLKLTCNASVLARLATNIRLQNGKENKNGTGKTYPLTNRGAALLHRVAGERAARTGLPQKT